jgi:Peptidase family S41
VYGVLEGNIGYADLERLNVADVPPMFEQFANTLAIIFDMRGYPRGTAWSIAPRINTLRSSAAALFYRPLLIGASTFEQISFLQPLPPTITPVVRVPTVMLIDERAISQSEHTGLFLKAANGTTFIGSQTTGANGDVTAVVLPGGLRVTFTGHDVRWPDGRQLQRVGLVPDIEVKPTIAGIRAGRDELLERAVAFVQSNQR